MKKKVHLICNAHIDPIWQWDWQEGVSATLSTFRSAVKLADKYDYIFCHNEVTVYKYAEEYDPELFEKIKELVKRGKWRIIGGWYLQPDCNMPSGESFVRQIRYGFKYFKDKFGVEPPETAFNVDAFGHSRGLVQILSKCGQNSLIVCRPYKNEMPLENNLFWWKGLDGSIIKVFRSPDSYNTPLGNAAAAIKDKANHRKDGEYLVLWGVGNHGGGPSDKDLLDIKILTEKDEEFEFVHSYPEAYFAENEPKSEIDFSLRISMPGCYTSLIEVKQKHIRLENELYLAEIMSAVADLKGLSEYPTEKLYSCFENLLNGEFHDVLPGSCIKAGEDNGKSLFDGGYLEATKIKTKAYFALMNGEPAAKEGEYPVIVFNPHPYALKENIECEFMLADQNWSDKISVITVKDGDKIIKSQQTKEDSNVNLDWRKKVIFEAELPPMGIKRFSVYVERKDKIPRVENSGFVYEDGEKYVEIDKSTGLLKSFRIRGKEYVKDGFALYMYDDNPDPWAMGAFQQKRIGENCEKFVLAQAPSGIFEGMKSVQVIENGDIYLGIEAFFEKANSKARIEYRIYKNTPDIDIAVNLYFNEANKVVKLEVPVVNGSEVFGQTAFGTEKLFDDGRENVAQRFVAVKAGERAVGLLNKSVYGSSYSDGKLNMTLVRGTTYCAHPVLDRDVIPTDRFTQKADQGEHDYFFRLSVAHENELERKASEFNRKPYAVNVFPTGTKRQEKNFSFEAANKDVTLVAFKKSEEKRGYVLRFINNSKSPAKTKVSFCGKEIECEFGVYEVKTYLFDGEKITEEREMII